MSKTIRVHRKTAEEIVAKHYKVQRVIIYDKEEFEQIKETVEHNKEKAPIDKDEAFRIFKLAWNKVLDDYPEFYTMEDAIPMDDLYDQVKEEVNNCYDTFCEIVWSLLDCGQPILLQPTCEMSYKPVFPEEMRE